MDSFLKSLLAAQPIPTKRCVVVVDNAKYHPERWTKLPRKVRSNLLKTYQSAKLNRGVDLHSSSRWGIEGSGRTPRTSLSDSAIPRPPSQPQRQQSLGAAPLPPSQPQRQKSVSSEEIAPISATAVSQRKRAPLPPTQPRRHPSIDVQDWVPPSSRPPFTGINGMNTLKEEASPEVPRMPRRKPSQDLRGSWHSKSPQMPQSRKKKTSSVIRCGPNPAEYDVMPPAHKLNASTTQPLFKSFPHVKRSSASLIDDDSDSDCDEDCDQDKPELFNTAFIAMRAVHGF